MQGPPYKYILTISRCSPSVEQRGKREQSQLEPPQARRSISNQDSGHRRAGAPPNNAVCTFSSLIGCLTARPPSSPLTLLRYPPPSQVSLKTFPFCQRIKGPCVISQKKRARGGKEKAKREGRKERNRSDRKSSSSLKEGKENVQVVTVQRPRLRARARSRPRLPKTRFTSNTPESKKKNGRRSQGRTPNRAALPFSLHSKYSSHHLHQTVNRILSNPPSPPQSRGAHTFTAHYHPPSPWSCAKCESPPHSDT